jgi:hypothetical protein
VIRLGWPSRARLILAEPAGAGHAYFSGISGIDQEWLRGIMGSSGGWRAAAGLLRLACRGWRAVAGCEGKSERDEPAVTTCDGGLVLGWVSG